MEEQPVREQLLGVQLVEEQLAEKARVGEGQVEEELVGVQSEEAQLVVGQLPGV